MLKRKILAAVLPVVAAGTVVGSGFSAWYFGDWSNVNGGGKVGITITDEANSETGSFKVYYNSSSGTVPNLGTLKTDSDKIKLVLDQGTGSDRNTNLTKGLSFIMETTTSDPEPQVTSQKLEDLTFRYVIKDESFDALNKANLQIDLSFSIQLNTTLSQYVKIKYVPSETQTTEGSYNWCTGEKFTFDKDSYTFKSSIESATLTPGSGEKYYDIRINLNTLNEVNEFLEYVKKPNNSIDYGNMESTLAAVTDGITFTYVATTKTK